MSSCRSTRNVNSDTVKESLQNLTTNAQGEGSAVPQNDVKGPTPQNIGSTPNEASRRRSRSMDGSRESRRRSRSVDRMERPRDRPVSRSSLHSSVDSDSYDYYHEENSDDQVIDLNEQTDSEEAATNKFIEEHYGLIPKDTYVGPPVATLLAETIHKWATIVPQKDEIRAAFEKCKIPENVSALGPIKVNDNIFGRLSFKAKEYDKKLRIIASYLKRAMGPLTYIWDSLIKGHSYSIKRNLDLPFIKTMERNITLQELTVSLASAMKLLCLSNSLNLQSRKNALLPQLDPRYYALTSHNNPIITQLFGDNLEQKVSDIYKVSQAARNPKMNTIRQRRGNRTIHYPGQSFKTVQYRRFGGQFRGQGQSRYKSNYKRSTMGQRASSFNKYQINYNNRGNTRFNRSARGRRPYHQRH